MHPANRSYKIFLNYPDALRPAFQRLKDKLEDQDPSVQGSAVNVVCELARKNPKNYLSLAPTFFKILTSSQVRACLRACLRACRVCSRPQPGSTGRGGRPACTHRRVQLTR